MQPCTACPDIGSTRPGSAGSLLSLLCGALFVFLVLIRASKCSLGSSCPLACLSSNETLCAARLWGHSALETSRALSFDCQEAQGSPGCCEHEGWCQPLAHKVWSWQDLDPSLPQGLEMGDVSSPCCLLSR